MAGRGSATRAAASSWTRLRTRPGSPPHRRPALGNPPGGAVRRCSRPSIRGSKTRFGHPSIAPINRPGAGTSPTPAAGPKIVGSGEGPGLPRIGCQCVAWSGDQTTGCAALTVTLVSAVHLAPRVGGTGDGCGCSGRSASRSRASQGRAIAHGSATRTVAKSTLPVAIARAHKRQAQQKFIEDPPVTYDARCGKCGWLLVPRLFASR
jgi:hypothetical protein